MSGRAGNDIVSAFIRLLEKMIDWLNVFLQA